MNQHAPLIIDIAGLKLGKADRQRLKHPLTGGIILFSRNWESRQQLAGLCADQWLVDRHAIAAAEKRCG